MQRPDIDKFRERERGPYASALLMNSPSAEVKELLDYIEHLEERLRQVMEVQERE